MELDIKYCGVCHSDVHMANNDFGNAIYPMVPGHELAGIVTKVFYFNVFSIVVKLHYSCTMQVGKNVKGFKIGDKVGVGCLVESCMDCTSCNNNDEVGCVKGSTQTYGMPVQHNLISTDTGMTYGGYSGRISVHKRFAVKVREKF